MITVNKDLLVDALKKLYPIIPFNSSVFVLKNFRIEFKEDHLEIAACNLDIYSKIMVPATSDNLLKDNLKGLFEGKGLFSLLKKIRYKTNISITIEDSIINLKTDKKFKTKLFIGDARDFPAESEYEDDCLAEINNSKLIKLFKKTAFACKENDSRESLRCCNIILKEESIYCAATNGHKLSMFEIEEENEKVDIIEVNINKNSVMWLINNLNDKTYSKIFLSDRHFILESKNEKTWIKFNKTQFPDIKKVIPEEFQNEVILNKNDVMEALDLTSTLSNKKTKLVRFEFSKDNLKLISINRDIGASSEQDIEIEFEKDSKVLGFNADYLMEILSRIDTENFSISYGTQVSPCIFRNVIKDTKKNYGDLLLLLMPLRILD